MTHISQSHDLTLAIDIGGTKVDAAIVDGSGQVLPGTRRRAATGPATDADQLRSALGDVIDAARSRTPPGRAVTGVGVGSAGPIDHDAGTIAPLNMPRLEGLALRDEVRDLVGGAAPVEIGLDGLCIALAEWRWGAGRGCRNLVSMVVSTGIGAGVIADGRPVRGSDGNAGHIGQMRVASGTRDDPRAGTLEDTASGPATVAWARAQGWSGESGQDLVRSANAGDATALAAITRSAHAVGEALAGASALLGFDTAIIGGGFALHAPRYLEQVQERVAEMAILPSARRLRVTRPGLQDDAPLVGAAQLAVSSDDDAPGAPDGPR